MATLSLARSFGDLASPASPATDLGAAGEYRFVIFRGSPSAVWTPPTSFPGTVLLKLMVPRVMTLLNVGILIMSVMKNIINKNICVSFSSESESNFHIIFMIDIKIKFYFYFLVCQIRSYIFTKCDVAFVVRNKAIIVRNVHPIVTSVLIETFLSNVENFLIFFNIDNILTVFT